MCFSPACLSFFTQSLRGRNFPRASLDSQGPCTKRFRVEQAASTGSYIVGSLDPHVVSMCWSNEENSITNKFYMRYARCVDCTTSPPKELISSLDHDRFTILTFLTDGWSITFSFTALNRPQHPRKSAHCHTQVVSMSAQVVSIRSLTRKSMCTMCVAPGGQFSDDMCA